MPVNQPHFLEFIKHLPLVIAEVGLALLDTLKVKSDNGVSRLIVLIKVEGINVGLGYVKCFLEWSLRLLNHPLERSPD